MGMIGNIKLMMKLNAIIPTVKQIARNIKELKLKFSSNLLSQTLALILQVANQAMDVTPDSYKFPVAVGITVIQGVIAVVAHFVNPDGTSAKTAYRK